MKSVLPDSIAWELDIAPGDRLLSINGEPVSDIFDYQFLVENEELTLLILKENGEEWELDIEKDEDEDLGLVFENGLMDDYRSCRNRCIFCFIDQLPKGMRDTLYFKDDDSRLSFLQGNYITLTNLSDRDVERIIRYHLSPVNISFHTTNPELRCRMLNNRFAGEALKKAALLKEAGISMNGQIVLCKGINDGEELNRTIFELTKLMPELESVSVVPVGLSRHREGLFPLEPFNRADAIEVLTLIHSWQDRIFHEYGTHFIHAGDEFYILAGSDIPEADTYDGYLQYENGVGMIRSFLDEFEEAFKEYGDSAGEDGPCAKAAAAGEDGLLTRAVTGEPAKQQAKPANREISLAGGLLMEDIRNSLLRRMEKRFPHIKAHSYGIKNDFFGDMITVSGLLTGQDIVRQLKGKPLGETLFLPENLLRSESDVLLDDMTLSDISAALQVKVYIVKSDGRDFFYKVLGE